MKTTIFVLCASTFLFFSCKKNGEFDNYNNLTKDSWKVKDIHDEQGNSVLKKCEADDIIQFEAKSFTHLEGAKDCSTGLFLKDAEWSFADDGSAIKIKKVYQTDRGLSGAGVKDKYYIITLNETELVIKKEHEDKVYYFER